MLCLKVNTDAGWARHAVAQLGSVLVDHAHCEMKAASNALSLAMRCPNRAELTRPLTELAREEIDHFQKVLSLLEARGLSLGPAPVDPYAAALRSLCGQITSASSLSPLVDRLLIAALIEARSCERFKRLIEALEALESAEHRDVLDLYRTLFPAEARHFRLFVDLALKVAPKDAASVHARLDALAVGEAQVLSDLAQKGINATIHG